MRKELIYELRMMLAVKAMHAAMCLAPRSDAGLRLIRSIGEHFEAENQLPEVFK